MSVGIHRKHCACIWLNVLNLCITSNDLPHINNPRQSPGGTDQCFGYISIAKMDHRLSHDTDPNMSKLMRAAQHGH